MYSFALCDDDAEFQPEFKKSLAALLDGKAVRCKYELTCFDSASGLMEAIDRGDKYDLIFLDVMLGDGNGVDLARKLREKHYGGDIVFISACRDFAFDSFDVRPLHYLQKAPGYDRLEAAIDRFLEKNGGSTLYLTTPKGTVALDLDSIAYFEVYGHELIMHRADGSKTRHRGTLKNMEEMLPPMTFARTQRSYLVNLSYVKEINRREVSLTTGGSVPIGRGMYDGVKLKFLDYMAKKKAFI